MLYQFFEHLAERLAAQVATMLASTLERLRISHQARERQQLEELARQCERDGHEKLAAWIRAKNQTAAAHTPAADGAQLLNELAGSDSKDRGHELDGPPRSDEHSQAPSRASRRPAKGKKPCASAKPEFYPLEDLRGEETQP